MNMQINKPEMLTINAIAERGILPERAIRRFVAEKKIPVIKSGRTQYINVSYLLELINDTGSILYQ